MIHKEYRAGDVWLGNGNDYHSAHIDGLNKQEEFGSDPWHYGVITCYGKGEEGAKALRDIVLAALKESNHD